MYGKIEEHSTTKKPIPNESIPISNQLPQTGGIPVETFYIFGGIGLLSSVFLLCINVKNKTPVVNNEGKRHSKLKNKYLKNIIYFFF